MSELEPRIYVACLAAYNEGQLHGCWIDADQSEESLYEAVQAMLAESPVAGAEEWAIHDYEGFGGYSLSEYTGLDQVADIAAFIREHQELGVAVLNYTGGDLEQSQVMIDEQYHGLYATEKDFTESFFEEMHEIPAYLIYYIDYEKMAKDWFLSDFMSLDMGHQVAVFSVR